ncbi:MAG TPA: type II toxin-antitoxin system RelE/ParE family toxin [Deltaproteobacteria bacterium]|nr:type II toxin-antitoxin system RelE/ParE family toxin [Deltaproteobacteria bacterium]
MYHINWSPKAFRQLGKIADRRAVKNITVAIDQLSAFPFCRGIRRLAGHEYDYRLRVGRYRVLFDVHREVRIIEIQEVRRRDERTY